MPTPSAQHIQGIRQMRLAAPSLRRRRTLSRGEVVAERRRSARAHRSGHGGPAIPRTAVKKAEVYDPAGEAAPRERVDRAKRLKLLLGGTALMFAFGGIVAQVMNHF